MKIESHILGENEICARCALHLPATMLSHALDRSLIAGDRLGLISGLKHSEDSTYLIRKPQHDSNKLCLAR